MKRTRPKGTGVWTCGNCRWLKEKDADGYCCEDDGVKETDQPCNVSARYHGGEFEAIGFGPKLSVIKFEELDAGEVALARWAIEFREEQLTFAPRADLKEGLRVVAKTGHGRVAGVITKIDDGYVHVKSDAGASLSLYPGNIEVQTNQ